MRVDHATEHGRWPCISCTEGQCLKRERSAKSGQLPLPQFGPRRRSGRKTIPRTEWRFNHWLTIPRRPFREPVPRCSRASAWCSALPRPVSSSASRGPSPTSLSPAGELPVIRFGRRIVVPKAALLELLRVGVFHWLNPPSTPADDLDRGSGCECGGRLPLDSRQGPRRVARRSKRTRTTPFPPWWNCVHSFHGPCPRLAGRRCRAAQSSDPGWRFPRFAGSQYLTPKPRVHQDPLFTAVRVPADLRRGRRSNDPRPP